MKKLGVLVLCMLVLCSSVNGFADPEPFKTNTFEIGPEFSYVVYNEPDVMQEKGWMYGVSGSYAYHNKFMLGLDGKISWGHVDYSSDDSGEVSDIPNTMMECRGVLGYDFLALENANLLFYITPYLGLGYRYLKDNADGKKTDKGRLTYERESNYLYTPMGLEIVTKMDNGWTIGGTAEYDLFWQGWQKSHLGTAVAEFDTVNNVQHRGFGVRGSVMFAKEWEHIGLVLEPYIRYWNIDKSEESDIRYSGVIVGYGYEPKNTSAEYGIKVSLTF
ncbi:MAG: hypothetical protein ABIH85_04575 [Candidatus Omnitrophota bacterium]|nr:hypothetical protein [Candidatus Omnitrophota bacterium]MBU1894437.1 hypothetical protein [Candidatus Omnitrophota bacterium]